LEQEISVVVIRVAVASNVPGHGPITRTCKITQLLVPVVFVAAYAMQENHGFVARTAFRIGDARVAQRAAIGNFVFDAPRFHAKGSSRLPRDTMALSSSSMLQ